MKSEAEILNDLKEFAGTEKYHQFSLSFPNTILTDGTKYLAEEAGCYWLFDIIGSIEFDMRSQDFLFCKFARQDSKGALTITDGNEKVLYTHEIGYTNFPLDEIQFYAVKEGDMRLIMLKSEY